MNGFEIIESGSRMPATTTQTTPSTVQNTNVQTKGEKAMDMLSNNFENILNLAGSIVEIRKMKVASEACLAKMAEDRKRIIDEAQAYAVKKRADTSSVVDRMNVIRSMMQDFYAHSQGNLSGDDFCKIITEVVNQMGRVEDGIK
jgi:histidinol dehydrogenase